MEELLDLTIRLLNTDPHGWRLVEEDQVVDGLFFHKAALYHSVGGLLIEPLHRWQDPQHEPYCLNGLELGWLNRKLLKRATQRRMLKNVQGRLLEAHTGVCPRCGRSDTE